MSDRTSGPIADLLVALQQAVLGAGGRPDALGPVSGPWLAVRRALGLDGRWHSREEALMALRAAATVLEAARPAAELDAGEVCPVCLDPLPGRVSACPSCGSSVA